VLLLFSFFGYWSGAQVECIYMLMTFGIPVRGFPLTHDGEILLENHKDLLKQRKNIDEKKTDMGRIILPGPYDVLFGRGKSFQEHPGNMRYRQLVESHMEMYEAANKIEKTGMYVCLSR
jgi:hypothetical protein